MRADGFDARSPASVSATAVGWCAKSSYTVTPCAMPTTSRRRLMPANDFSASPMRSGPMPTSVATEVGVGPERIGEALRSFAGIKRRLEVVGKARGVTVYDDFAHHPTAVAETLAGLRASCPSARIWAVFEPRSASSCRRVFQDDFARAFGAADEVLLAPVFRSTLPEPQRLSIPQLVKDLEARGQRARASES